MTNIIYYRKIYLLFCSVNIKTTEGWLNVFEKCDFKALIHRRCEFFECLCGNSKIMEKL